MSTLMRTLMQVAGLPADAPLVPMDAGHSGSSLKLLRLPQGRFVVKTGLARKVRAEAERCLAWSISFPGVAREVLYEASEADQHAFVGEYLDGTSLASVYAGDDEELVRAATTALLGVLERIWEGTRDASPPPPSYAAEIGERLELLFRDRPELREILGRPVAGGTTGTRLLSELRRREPDLLPGFSVLTHGDLTPDNVLCEPASGRVRFVDLARSAPGDYVMDAGKFVAALRRARWDRPVVEGTLPERMVMRAMTSFAERTGDATLEARFQVSVARTLLGSARLMELEQTEWQLLRGLEALARALS